MLYIYIIIFLYKSDFLWRKARTFYLFFYAINHFFFLPNITLYIRYGENLDSQYFFLHLIEHNIFSIKFGNRIIFWKKYLCPFLEITWSFSDKQCSFHISCVLIVVNIQTQTCQKVFLSATLILLLLNGSLSSWVL